MEETMYQTTRQTGIATDTWASDSSPNRTAMLQVFLVVLSADEGYADRRAASLIGEQMEEGGGQRHKSADFAARDEALLERRKETTGLGKFMALERPRQQMMIMDGNRTNLHGIVLDNSKLVMLVSGIKAKNTTRRTSTWHRDMKVQRAREARMPYRGSRSNP